MNTNKDWLDIASAPKDGTPVLLFARHIDAEASTRVVGWFHSEYGWIAQSYVGQPFARLIPSLWAELMPFPGSPASTVATEGEKTPGATWREKGDADPHGDLYACERAALAMGNLTDDDLANGAFMNYDRPLDIDALMQRRPGYHPPIAWMTAVKDRIRWLSRKLEEAKSAPAAGDAPGYTLAQKYEDACIVANANARDAERYRWLCDKFGITKLPCAIERIIEGTYVADGKNGIDAAIDAAIAQQSQRKEA